MNVFVYDLNNFIGFQRANEKKI